MKIKRAIDVCLRKDDDSARTGAPVEWYTHHGNRVAVFGDLRGLHRDCCLCYECAKFKPESREENCPTASLLYALCVRCGLTTPVWECPDYQAPETPELLDKQRVRRGLVEPKEEETEA